MFKSRASARVSSEIFTPRGLGSKMAWECVVSHRGGEDPTKTDQLRICDYPGGAGRYKERILRDWLITEKHISWSEAFLTKSGGGEYTGKSVFDFVTWEFGFCGSINLLVFQKLPVRHNSDSRIWGFTFCVSYYKCKWSSQLWTNLSSYKYKSPEKIVTS